MRVQQVLFNLLSNAIKFSKEESEIKVEVTHTVNIRKKQQKVRISVVDQGIGMNEEDQKKLFMPYFRSTDA